MYVKIVLLLLLLLSFYISRNSQNAVAAERLEKENYFIVFLSYNILIIGYMYISGVLSSGYHLIDDHEVYTYGRSISELGLLPALKKILSDDMMGVTNSRFRFTYIIIRVLQIYFMKDHFVMWHLLYAVLTSVNMFFAYIFARKQNCSVWISYAFSIVIFFGSGQSAVMWRLGPQENLGLLILFMLLIYMTKKQDKRKTIILIILAIFLGGIKESFLMLLPVLPIMMSIWDVRSQNESVTIGSLLNEIKKNKIFTLITWLIFVIDIAIIVFVVGTNNNGYAGVDASMGLKSIVYNVYYVLTGKLKVYLLLSLLGIVILGICIGVYYKKEKVAKKQIIDKMIIYGLLYGYILVTQVILHLKSGMFERYLLPSVVAFAMIWMIDLYVETMDLHISAVYKGFLLLLVVVLIVIGKDQREAVKYAKDGADVTAAFSQIAKLFDDDVKVVVGIGYEADASSSVYLQEHYGIDAVYNVFLNGIENGMVKDCYDSNAQEIQAIVISEADVYLDYQGSLEEIFMEYGIDKSLCIEYEYGDYRVIVNRNG